MLDITVNEFIFCVMNSYLCVMFYKLGKNPTSSGLDITEILLTGTLNFNSTK